MRDIRIVYRILYHEKKFMATDFRFNYNKLIFDANDADIDGFNNEDNLLQVNKTFDGDGFITLFIKELYEQFINTKQSQRKNHGESIVKITAIKESEDSSCLDKCKNISASILSVKTISIVINNII